MISSDCNSSRGDLTDQQEREKELEQQELLQSLEKQQLEDSTNGINLEDEAKLEYQRRGKRILLAAEKGRLFELAYYIHLDSNLVHYTDSDGYTPLHRASYAGYKDCAKYLLKHGADINARTIENWTPLHCAARWNNLIVAEYLLKQGADVNATSSGGNTPLHISASNGPYSITCDMIQLLLYHPDCNYNARNSSNDRAYDLAKRNGPFYKLWSGVETPNFNPDDEHHQTLAVREINHEKE